MVLPMPKDTVEIERERGGEITMDPFYLYLLKIVLYTRLRGNLPL
jgi:hypothetical protein